MGLVGSGGGVLLGSGGGANLMQHVNNLPMWIGLQVVFSSYHSVAP